MVPADAGRPALRPVTTALWRVRGGLPARFLRGSLIRGRQSPKQVFAGFSLVATGAFLVPVAALPSSRFHGPVLVGVSPRGATVPATGVVWFTASVRVKSTVTVWPALTGTSRVRSMTWPFSVQRARTW